jgi:PPM family protein phosphatase
MSEPGHQTPADESTIDLPPPAPTAPPSVRVEFGARTHVGRVRHNNEDHHLIARLSKSLQVLRTDLPRGNAPRVWGEEGYLLAVADGMGGAAAGERASALVVEGLEKYVLDVFKWFSHPGDPQEDAFMDQIRTGLEWLDRTVIDEAQADRSRAGMGTTLTSAISIGADLLVIHVGDSRAYLFHEGHLEQLTRDHTVTQMLIEGGLLRPEEARSHRRRHVITNVLGGPERGVRGEVHKLRLADGDRLLLCTDGLSEPVGDEQIAELLGLHPDPEDACQALVDAALSHGGPDNVTVVLAAYTITAQ